METDKITDTADLRVSDIMKRDLIVANPKMKSREVGRLLHQNRISGAPVLDDDGRLLGVVSLSDVVRSGNGKETAQEALADEVLQGVFHPAPQKRLSDKFPEEPDAETVGEIMTPPLVTARETFTVAEVAKMMADEHVHRVIILDAAGQLSGIVSSMDIVRTVGKAARKKSHVR